MIKFYFYIRIRQKRNHLFGPFYYGYAFVSIQIFLNAGLIGSFLSQGLSLVEATEAAVDLHSKAADIAFLELGLAIVPTDIINNIRYFLK